MKEEDICIFWFRRDLRIEDNKGLKEALTSGYRVLPLFIFDKNILLKLEDKDDGRVTFIYKQLQNLNNVFRKYNSTLRIDYGTPLEVFKKVFSEFKQHLKLVAANTDYEPYAQERDIAVKEFLLLHAIDFLTFKDHVILEKNEVLKSNKHPYTVFTPYKKKWLNTLQRTDLTKHHSHELLHRLLPQSFKELPPLSSFGFQFSEFSFPSLEFNKDLVLNYKKNRDYPAINGTTKWSLHLRFGTISTRFLFRLAEKHSDTLKNELIWREFYQMIIYHFPESATCCFKPAYERINWENDTEKFEKWCKGLTGYPMVDAGMRELNQTGFMHNRTRMLTASFLTKHLLIDWRWGERYFARKLLDFELASNVGGWQWSAGTGCDAAPYFRIFNPLTQQKKFDPDETYVKRWIPELNTKAYPLPIVNHKEAREKALKTYKTALNET